LQPDTDAHTQQPAMSGFHPTYGKD